MLENSYYYQSAVVDILLQEIKLKQMKKRKIIKYFSSSATPWNRSEHMKMLHAQGRYAGTSKIGLWNSSEEKRERMRNIMKANALDKSSRGYGSEYAMRVNNRTLLHNQFQGESGYLYFIKFPGSIKVGFSKNWERRLQYQLPHQFHILGGKVIMIISGPTSDLADLEFDTFMEFQKYTQLSKDGTRYTEFMDLRAKKQVYEFLKKKVQENKNLKFEVIQNQL